MNIVKAYSRTSFMSIFLVIVLLLALVDSAFYYGMNILFTHITFSIKAGSITYQATGLSEIISFIDNQLRYYFVPVSVCVFFSLGLMLWLFLKSSVKKLADQVKPQKSGPKQDDMEQKAAEKQKKELNDQRLFLHLFSVLQREGRLVDFFNENLDSYEDSQIGAAVRNIHENCNKTINKYISLKAVIDQDEGDNVTIEPGFDPGSIKLIGNVAGEPPFKGVLRHRGWQVIKLDLPKLSDTGKLQAISPAEVEIQ
jgi:hypothetical protein